MIILGSCERDPEVKDKDYPFVILKDIIINDSESVVFQGKILSPGKSDIKRFGFVWDVDEKPAIDDMIYVFSDSVTPREFEYKLRFGLSKNARYHVRSFVEDDHYIVYSNERNFIPGFSINPVIYDFEPKQGIGGNSIKISGENFIPFKNKINVNFGKLQGTIDSATINELYVTTPKINHFDTLKIEVRFFGLEIISEKCFQFVYP